MTGQKIQSPSPQSMFQPKRPLHSVLIRCILTRNKQPVDISVTIVTEGAEKGKRWIQWGWKFYQITQHSCSIEEGLHYKPFIACFSRASILAWMLSTYEAESSGCCRIERTNIKMVANFSWNSLQNPRQSYLFNGAQSVLKYPLCSFT